jgi:hypothetical protein
VEHSGATGLALATLELLPTEFVNDSGVIDQKLIAIKPTFCLYENWFCRVWGFGDHVCDVFDTSPSVTRTLDIENSGVATSSDCKDRFDGRKLNPSSQSV